MVRRSSLLSDRSGTAAVEMALVAPFLILLMFLSVEMGNYMMTEQAVAKQVRDGARYAARIPIDSYDCSKTKPAEPANGNIIKVTQTGSVDGTATGRFPATFWTNACAGSTSSVSVTLRCVPKTNYSGVWAGLGTDIPVVKVSADVPYTDLFGISLKGLCMHASSEAPVAGL